MGYIAEPGMPDPTATTEAEDMRRIAETALRLCDKLLAEREDLRAELAKRPARRRRAK
jgi:hypothetical protein